MTGKENIRILLIEDDEDDYKIIKETLSEINHMGFSLDWVPETGRLKKKIQDQEYDICLMDYRLGEINGIDLMKDLTEKGFEAPFIILTGYGDHDIDVRAMKSGAADYLEKDKIYPGMLERSIRYSLERKRHMDALRISEQRLRVMSAKLVDAQEDERKRVAKEIHDGIGSNLVAIKYGMESILTRMGNSKPYREGISIEKIIDYIKETIEEAQRISSNLRPSVLDDMGLAAAVRWICRRYQEIYPDIRIHKRLKPEDIDAAQYIKVAVFRVLQEAMNNVVKHSSADSIHLEIKKNDEQILLTVRDNGKGFNADEFSGEQKEAGLGLMSMKERTELSGGYMDIQSGEGKGCVVCAVWPLNELIDK